MGEGMLGLILVQKNSLTNYSESQSIRLGDSTIVLGRADAVPARNNVIQLLAFPQVSRCHATIVHRDGNWFLFDGVPRGQPSKTGVIVNNKRLVQRPHKLQDGDRVILHNRIYRHGGASVKELIGFKVVEIPEESQASDTGRLFQTVDPLTTCDPDDVARPRISQGEQEARAKVFQLEKQMNNLLSSIEENGNLDKMRATEMRLLQKLVFTSMQRIRALTVALSVVTTFTVCVALAHLLFTSQGKVEDNTERVTKTIESALQIVTGIVALLGGGAIFIDGAPPLGRTRRTDSDPNAPDIAPRADYDQGPDPVDQRGRIFSPLSNWSLPSTQLSDKSLVDPGFDLDSVDIDDEDDDLPTMGWPKS